MSLIQLSLETLKDIDRGKVDRSVAKHLARAASDCYDRPGDPAARKVTMEISITPITGQDANCDKVNCQVEVFSKIPRHRSDPVSLRLGRNGALAFNPDSEGNVDQETFLDGG